jgi:hypothetical protein
MAEVIGRRRVLTPVQIGVALQLHWHYDFTLLEIAHVLQVTPQRIARTFRLRDSAPSELVGDA